jgi:hypothetical protein
MRIVLDILHADEGSVTWNGHAAARVPKRTWGYLPEDRGLYPRMKVLDQLVFFGSLHGLRRADAAARGQHWPARFRISNAGDIRVAGDGDSHDPAPCLPPHLGRGAAHHHPAAIDDRDRIAQLLDLVHLVGAEHDRPAPVLQLQERLLVERAPRGALRQRVPGERPNSGLLDAVRRGNPNAWVTLHALPAVVRWRPGSPPVN